MVAILSSIASFFATTTYDVCGFVPRFGKEIAYIFYLVIVLILSYPIVYLMKWMNYLLFKRRSNFKNEINNEIDISIEPEARQKGQIVGLTVVNNNYNKPVFCKAIIRRMDWLKEDPKNGSKWVPINTKQYSALSWFYGGTNSEGFKKVHINSEFINIAKFPIDMGQEFSAGGIIWRFTFSFIHKEEEFFVGKYRLQIEIICQIGDKYKIENWLGCIDMPNVRENLLNWSELSIWECEDVKNWKSKQSKQ